MIKKIIFVIESLNIGGAERSIVNLLNTLEVKKYDIDLQLFVRGEAFERYIPPYVNILPLPYITNYLKKPIIKQLQKANIFLSRLRLFFRIRLSNKMNSVFSMIYWEELGKYFPKNGKKYDIAIAYSQGIPTFFVRDKIISHQKITWLNTPYCLNKKSFKFNKRFYIDFDKIVVVSPYLVEYWKEKLYAELIPKLTIIRDITNPHLIEKFAKNSNLNIIRSESLILTTVCRLDKQPKGLDILLETALLLNEKKIKFIWYIVGTGPFFEELKKYIRDHKLENNLILTGATCNPYPYIKQCDIYVQTSRSEGYGLTIIEAKILNKPIVSTNFETIKLHITDSHNGLISSFNPQDMAEKIELLKKDAVLYNKIVNNLKKEKKGNVEEIDKFYKLING